MMSHVGTTDLYGSNYVQIFKTLPLSEKRTQIEIHKVLQNIRFKHVLKNKKYTVYKNWYKKRTHINWIRMAAVE